MLTRRPKAFGRRVLLLRKRFERDDRARESAKEFHSCRSSKLRGVLDERTHRIREDDDEDQRDALKSFVRSETSADREARATFFLLDERTTTTRTTTKREKKGDIREKSAGF